MAEFVAWLDLPDIIGGTLLSGIIVLIFPPPRRGSGR